MSNAVRLTDNEVAALSEMFVAEHMLPKSPDDIYNTINSVYPFVFITSMKEQAEKEKEHFASLSEEELYPVAIVKHGKPSIVYCSKRNLINKAEALERYGGMDLLGTQINLARKAIEVKTDREAKYLHRDAPDNNNGTLGFEIWSDVNRDREGWTYEYVHYKEFTSRRIEQFIKKYKNDIVLLKQYMEKYGHPATYCFPDVFVYLLVYEKGLNIYPYASICFENTQKLFELIDNILDGRLFHWQSSNKYDILQEGYIGNAYMQKNMLYVPLDDLIKLPDVTVTILDKFPDNEATLAYTNNIYRDKKTVLIPKRKEFLSSIQTSNEIRNDRIQKSPKVSRKELSELEKYVSEALGIVVDPQEEYQMWNGHYLWPYYFG